MDGIRVNRANLLEDLQREMKLEYLSDIRDDRCRENALRTLGGIRIADYTLQQWSAALSYILNTSVTFENDEQVAQYVRNKLTAPTDGV